MEYFLTSGSGKIPTTSSKAAKKKYRVTNWPEYNKSLVKRGDITLWFNEKMLENWGHANDQTKVGRPFVFSDRAIETLLTLREFFRLPYRQTEGLGHALLQEKGIAAVIPPRKNAKIKQHENSKTEPLVRDKALRKIRRIGCEAWKNSVEYHRRSLAETAMFRIKRCFGDKLKNRHLSKRPKSLSDANSSTCLSPLACLLSFGISQQGQFGYKTPAMKKRLCFASCE